MSDSITRKQFRVIESALDRKEQNKLLEKYTGIVAFPYTGYSYYDSAGNYIGDSNDYDLRDLLRNAYIKVED